MTDQSIQYTEYMVGANQPTSDDTLNRLVLVEHGNDGSHNRDIIEAGTEVNLSYVPDAAEMTARRLLHRDGSSLSRTTYSALFAKLGTIYGNVDANHFNLPDDRGRFLRMWDDGAGTDPDASSRTDRGDGQGGDYVGTLQDDEFESHTHNRKYRSSEFSGSADHDIQGPDTANTSLNYASQARGGNETRPKNIYKWGGIHY